MIRFINAFIIFVAFITTSGCTHSVDPNEQSNNSTKHPRTYKWTLDTLFYSSTPDGSGQTVMLDIWGVNDTTVYAVGHDAYGKGVMWKFDGKKWERVRLHTSEGGTLSQTFTIYAIKGFAENNIYAFGESSTNFTGEYISSTAGIHYDGIQWRKIPLPPGTGIFSLVAPSPSMLYCGGEYTGQVYHFDGIQWSVDTITTSPFPDLDIMVRVIGASSTQGVYLQTTQFKNVTGGFQYKQIIKRINSKSIVLDSAFNDPPWGGRSFWQSEAGNLYSCGTGGIFLMSGDKWKAIYSPEVILSIFGISDQHIFAVGISNIYFYDGITWEKICPYIGTSFSVHLWCSETDVFILCSDNKKTYVFHGK